MTKKTANSGFTLIELLVTLVVVGILALIGIPSYIGVTKTNRIATEMNAFIGALQYARSEAIKRGDYVTVCASTDGATCVSTVTQNWSTGWIVFTDPNDNATVDAGETILRIQAALQGGDTLTSNAGGSPAITFNRNGFSTNAQTLALDNTGAPLAHPSCAVISTVGRVRVGTIQNKSQPISSNNCVS